MADPEPLLELSSPDGSGVAVVEADDRVVYFYLFFPDFHDEARKMRSCWVRNLQAAPAKPDRAAMADGQPPMLPDGYCQDSGSGAPLSVDELRVVWFEECDGAGLFERDELLAVIPGWSGTNGFHGYARDCIAESPVCWPLEADNAMHERLQRAKAAWHRWDDDTFWQRASDAIMQVLTAQWGPESRYFAIDGKRFPPRGLAMWRTDDATIFHTVGMSLLPQPGVEHALADPSPFRRIELAVKLPRDCAESDVNHVGRYLSSLGGYPWSMQTWFAPSHTVPCNLPPARGGNRFPSALLVYEWPGLQDLPLPSIADDRDLARTLWLLPISTAERDLAIRDGCDALIARMESAGVAAIANERPSCV